MMRQIAKSVETLGIAMCCLRGMNSDGGKKRRMRFRELHRPSAGLEVQAWYQHAGDARMEGALDHGFPVGVEGL